MVQTLTYRHCPYLEREDIFPAPSVARTSHTDSASTNSFFIYYAQASKFMADISTISAMAPLPKSAGHRYLPESHASSIQSWARGVPEQSATSQKSTNSYQNDPSAYSSSDPAVQAYLRLKLALLSKRH